MKTTTILIILSTVIFSHSTQLNCSQSKSTEPIAQIFIDEYEASDSDCFSVGPNNDYVKAIAQIFIDIHESRDSDSLSVGPDNDYNYNDYIERNEPSEDCFIESDNPSNNSINPSKEKKEDNSKGKIQKHLQSKKPDITYKPTIFNVVIPKQIEVKKRKNRFRRDDD